MKHIRRTLSSIAALIAAIAGLLVLAPSAFAAYVLPADGSASNAPDLGTGGGMLGWQIALIAVAAALVAAVVTAALMRSRLRAGKPATV